MCEYQWQSILLGGVVNIAHGHSTAVDMVGAESLGTGSLAAGPLVAFPVHIEAASVIVVVLTLFDL